MTIIHLSDLHIGKGKRIENTEALFEGIAGKYKNSDKDKIVIIITGDIVDDGMKTQLKKARVLIEKHLVNNGFSHILLCPGNHDYGKNGLAARDFNIYHFSKLLKQSDDYPIHTVINDCHFIGIDSMEEESDGIERFGAEGKIGKNQLLEVNDILEGIEANNNTLPDDEKKKICIYLHHHPFFYSSFLRLKDADDLKEVIKKRVNILLFGHKHEDKIFNGKRIKRNNTEQYNEDQDKMKKYSINLIAAAKSSTEMERGTDNKGKSVLRFNEIDMDTYTVTPVEIIV